MAVQIDCFKL